MAGAGVLFQPMRACAPQALSKPAESPSSWQGGARCLYLQGSLNVPFLPCKPFTDFQSKGRLTDGERMRLDGSARVRSVASRHAGSSAQTRKHDRERHQNLALPFATPFRQVSRAESHLHALAGPLLRRLRGQKREVEEDDENLGELLEDLNQRIDELNSQLKTGEADGSGSLPLLKSVAVPEHLHVDKTGKSRDLKDASEEEEWTGPSALTTMLVDYSMVVAGIWAMQGTIKQTLGQQVPAVAMNAVTSIGQPALDAVKSVTPPVVKYIGEPAMVAARYAGIPQGLGRVSDVLRSTPDLRGRTGAGRNRKRLTGIAAASKDAQGASLTDSAGEKDGADSSNGQPKGSPAQAEDTGKVETGASWWKGTLGSWEPLRWWSSGEGERSEDEAAAEAQLDPMIWPRMSSSNGASTSGRGENGLSELEEAGMAAAGEGILGAKVAGAKEQPSEAPGWDGTQKGEDPQQPLGFSFSAAGLLFPYHLGVCQKLMEAGLLTDKTPLAGSSAGAIVSAALGAGVTPLEALQMTKDLAKDCRKNGTAGRLGAVLRGILHEVLPENCHEMCNGRVRIAVTQLFRWPRGLLVDEFYSKEDVIEALITSSFIPGFLAPAAANVFRDRYCIDGGMTLFMPPTAGKETIRVCAFPASAYGLQGVQISPDCIPEGRASLRQLLSWALEPPSDGILDELYLQGHADAVVWVKSRENALKEDSDLQLAQV